MKNDMFPKNDKQWWPDETIYFLTDSTYLHLPLFNDERKKMIVYNQFKKINEKLKIPISAFSIAINHYHLKFYLPKGGNLAKIKQILRGGISFEYRKHFEAPCKEFWQTRKIFMVTKERINWKVEGYIIGNLLKHKEVSTFDELRGNYFSSYRHVVARYGEKAAKDLVYSVIDIDESCYGEVDVNCF